MSALGEFLNKGFEAVGKLFSGDVVGAFESVGQAFGIGNEAGVDEEMSYEEVEQQMATMMPSMPSFEEQFEEEKRQSGVPGVENMSAEQFYNQLQNIHQTGSQPVRYP